MEQLTVDVECGLLISVLLYAAHLDVKEVETVALEIRVPHQAVECYNSGEALSLLT